MKPIFGLFVICLMVLPARAEEVVDRHVGLPKTEPQVIEEDAVLVDTSSGTIVPTEMPKAPESQIDLEPLSSDFVFAGFTNSYFSKFRESLEEQGVDGQTAQMLTEVVRNQMDMSAWKEKIVDCMRDFGTTQADKNCFSDFSSESNRHLETILNSL